MPDVCLFAVQLRPATAADRGRLAGRLEHVLSGRLHDFDDGAALLALLAAEQSQAYSMETADSPAPAHATADGTGRRRRR
jgi:hypothetical protein